jgi:hypothetical protein
MLFPLKVAFEYDPLVDIGAGPQPGIVCCLGAHVTFCAPLQMISSA